MDGSPGNTLSPEEQIEVNENAKTSTAHHRSVQFTRPAREGGVAPDLHVPVQNCGCCLWSW